MDMVLFDKKRKLSESINKNLIRKMLHARCSVIRSRDIVLKMRKRYSTSRNTVKEENSRVRTKNIKENNKEEE